MGSTKVWRLTAQGKRDSPTSQLKKSLYFLSVRWELKCRCLSLKEQGRRAAQASSQDAASFSRFSRVPAFPPNPLPGGLHLRPHRRLGHSLLLGHCHQGLVRGLSRTEAEPCSQATWERQGWDGPVGSGSPGTGGGPQRSLEAGPGRCPMWWNFNPACGEMALCQTVLPSARRRPLKEPKVVAGPPSPHSLFE